jgi:NAD(P)-dependent dehydrogenase (short-subunit alcohol dehydrogenase family)
MEQSKQSRVVVVTGASAGVGRAVVQALAREGASIGLIARGRAGLEAARADVERLGGRALVLPCDVADAEAVEAAAAAVEEQFGPIDVWVNNAMVSVFSRVRDMTAEEYRRVTEVTYLGYVHGTLSALRRMLERDRGVIVQVGSALAYRGIPAQSAYCAAKHAIQGFNDSLRTELMHDNCNVRVTDVHLAAINTPQFGWVKSRLPNRAQPVPPIHQPEIAAEAILFVMDNERREMWVGWPTVKAIAGNRLVPWYADRDLAKDGIENQQIDGQPEPEDRPHNLWEPLDDTRDFGAHGSFDDQAVESTSQLWFSKNRNAVLGGVAAAGLALAAVGLSSLASGSESDGLVEEDQSFAVHLEKLIRKRRG